MIEPKEGHGKILSEENEQIHLAIWLNAKKLLWNHTPNGGYRNKIEAHRFKQLGVKAGFPDISIYTPPPNSPEARGVMIELKRSKGGTTSEYQEDWLVHLTAAGYLARVCHGANEAIKWLEALGY